MLEHSNSCILSSAFLLYVGSGTFIGTLTTIPEPDADPGGVDIMFTDIR